MRIPETPPDFAEITGKIVSESVQRFTKLISLGLGPDHNGQYYHWDKLKYLKLPEGVKSHEEWWFVLKTARKTISTKIPHKDKEGRLFFYCEPDSVRRLLHEIDIHGGGEIKTSAQVTNPSTKDMYLINSLIEESITSSQLEGAATTKKVAKEMLRQKRTPRDRSEKMILNNYHAMEFIIDISSEELTPEIILELHKILTQGTLDNSNAEGRLRESDDIFVGDERDSTIIHVPPKAQELPQRMTDLCKFANGNSTKYFQHPVVKAVILHFLLAYDHPFEDGNGRTARALFYWMMLRQGYWTMEFISISRILKQAPAKYARAYLHTETDDNDVSYFIIHQLEVILKAVNDLLKYLERKAKEIKSVEVLIKNSRTLQQLLNHRQIALINRALKRPEAEFFIESHRGAHNVTYDTARTDLLKLADLGLLIRSKIGKAFVFSVANDLEHKLAEL
ncbi:MAG: Fic family protein [Candidatus Marinimicrobia bacterium]|nr:Fic family protein [Candidatus Neomarinimicrobiota bacterium]